MILMIFSTTGSSELNNILESNNDIEDITWITGMDGKNKVLKTYPAVAGAIKYLFHSKEKQISLITLKDVSCAKKIIESAKNTKNTKLIGILPVLEEKDILSITDNEVCLPKFI